MPRQSPQPDAVPEPDAARRPDPAHRPGPARRPGPPGRRSYAHYCGAARALDAVGDRWTLLIVRELLAGPRRYTDLHADLPGVSTDMLASRLKDMERDGLATRRRLPPPASAFVYQLTARGHRLLPVLQALWTWGAGELGERRATDAVRAHWFALPLRTRLQELGASGVAEVRLDEGVFHVRVGASSAEPGDAGYGGPAGGGREGGRGDGDGGDGVPCGDAPVRGSGSLCGHAPVYGDGPAPEAPDARLRLTAATCTALATGVLTVRDAVRGGLLVVAGDAALARAVRGDA